MTLEQFAHCHHLPPDWLELRSQCEQVVRKSDFWYRPELQDDARRLATQASNILSTVVKQSSK